MTTPPWNPSGAPSNRNWSTAAPSKLAPRLARPSSTSSKPFITAAASIAPWIICARLTSKTKTTKPMHSSILVSVFLKQAQGGFFFEQEEDRGNRGEGGGR